MVCSITEAKYLGDYRIALVFSDGMRRIIDFGPFLTNARNPMTKKYLDKNLFKSFTLLNGDIMWNDFELCFPIWNLHEGNI